MSVLLNQPTVHSGGASRVLLSAQVKKFRCPVCGIKHVIKLMEDMFRLLIWQYQIQPVPLHEGMNLLSSRYM